MAQVIITGAKWSHSDLKDKTTIFLVGPSKRSHTPFVSYRKRFIELVNKEISNVVIFNPEFDPQNGFGDRNANLREIFANSQKWELEAMNDSKIIIMSLETDAENAGLTTRTELGFLLETRKNLIVYAPPNNYKIGYQVGLSKLKGIPIYSTLTDVIQEAKRMILHVPVVTAGRFNATEILANNTDPVVLRETILKAEEANELGAVWCYIDSKDMLNFNLLANVLKYTFHHLDHSKNQFVFYKWNNPTLDNKVPDYATAIGGARAMVLTEDETKVLFVYEEAYNKKLWRYPSGGVNKGELAIDCMLRELNEELGIKLENITIKLVGGYNQKSARYGEINDYFYTFVVNIPIGTQIKPDGHEVLGARWLDVNDVLSDKITQIDGISINKFNVDSLKTYVKDKKYMPCKIVGDKMTF